MRTGHDLRSGVTVTVTHKLKRRWPWREWRRTAVTLPGRPCRSNVQPVPPSCSSFNTVTPIIHRSTFNPVSLFSPFPRRSSVASTCFVQVSPSGFFVSTISLLNHTSLTSQQIAYGAVALVIQSVPPSLLVIQRRLWCRCPHRSTNLHHSFKLFVICRPMTNASLRK